MSIKRMNNKMKVVKACSIDPEVWLDYLEGELSDVFKSDLDLHRSHCDQCKHHLGEYKALRKEIVSAKKFADFPDDAFFKGLEAKIMAQVIPQGQVSSEPLASVTVIASRSRTTILVRRFAVPAASAAVLFLLIVGALLRSPTFSGTNDQAVAQNHLDEPYLIQAAFHNPEIVSNAMITSQDEDDLVLDATAEKMAHMSDNEVRAMMAQLR